MKKRVVSLVLIATMFIAFSSPALAALSVSGYGFDTALDTESGSYWSTYWSRELDKVQKLMKLLGYLQTQGQFSGISGSTVTDLYYNWLYATVGFGEVDEASARMGCRNLTNKFNSPAISNVASSIRNKDEFKELYAGDAQLAIQNLATILGIQLNSIVLRYDDSRGVYRPYENRLGKWVTDTYGRYFCFRPDTSSYDLDNSEYADSWQSVSAYETLMNKGENQFHMVSKSALDSMASSLGSSAFVTHWREYWVIERVLTIPELRVDYNGNAYACWYDEGTAAINSPRETTSIENPDDSSDTLTQNNKDTELNYNGMTIVLPDADLNVGDINYNSNNKTYNISAYKYDITNNYYYTYTYSWTYHINYTSITYIGQSEEYDKTYNVYYQLPDGRSSADLTAEELEQLNLSVDVINYGRSADDVRLRSLYHFDGTTDDASYWNYCTDFTWNTGASLTYMESGNFNGALYLDETEHDFTLTMPSSIGSQDFTLQFRYYQSYTAAPQDDSYIMLGSTKYFRMDGAQFRTGADSIYTLTGSNVFAATPIGTWNEIAIIRDDGTMRFYLNGVQVGSHGNLATIDKTINFHFGSAQQTYKELDELRVLNYALVTDGANYQPTSVPYDTNLALVLPDGVAPVADEYWNVVDDVSVWKFNPQLDDDLGMLVDVSAKTVPLPASGWSTSNVAGTIWASGEIDYYSPYTGVYPSGSTVILSNAINDQTTYPAVIPGTQNSYGYLRYYSLYKPALTLPVGSGICYGDRSDVYNIPVGGMNGLTPNEAYKCYLAFDDGTSLSLDFTIPSSVRSNVGAATVSTVSSDSGSLSLYRMRVDWLEYYYRVGYALSYVPPLGADVGLLYWAIVPTGSSIEVEKVESVTLMDSASLNTPTLAVRSDIPVTDYQIGGVRPSIPYKGLVYAMVESGYITSLQIYDGRAWVQVDGRIWTGERWIPYSSYNVVTLSDMYDIADASGQSGYEYIYTDTGFWSWLQKFLLKFREDLFALLQSGNTSSPGHQHVYTTEILREATCTESGLIQYTCTAGDHTYTAAIEPLEHDWVASEVVEDRYSLPEDTVCPNGVDHILTHVLDKSSGVYHVTCSDCGEEFDVDAEIEYGYTIYTCTRCGETYKESNKDSSGLFEALGNFFADGILWIVDKLTQLVEALNSISDIFNEFAQSLEESAGGYPEFFGEVLAVMPEDLMNVIWFAIIGVFAVAAWKKFFG